MNLGVLVLGALVKLFNRATGCHPLRLAINTQLERYGKMTSLKVDSTQKTIEATIELQGEDSPISILVGHYELDTTGDVPTLSVTGITVSRPWMQAIATDFLAGKKLPIPASVAKFLPMIL